MIKRVKHIGFAVHSIDETMKKWSAAYGAVELGRKSFPMIGQTSALVGIGESRFELMEPLGKEGVVPKFLEKHGEGFHHISFLSDNLDEDCEKFESAGIKILGKGQPVIFTSPKTSDGVVYEVTEEDD